MHALERCTPPRPAVDTFGNYDWYFSLCTFETIFAKIMDYGAVCIELSYVLIQKVRIMALTIKMSVGYGGMHIFRPHQMPPKGTVTSLGFYSHVWCHGPQNAFIMTK